ncbi:MAG: hypothetical protein O6703_01630 [Gammaproteobacteria bacterium]|nr:hypothetical protein [Gammaproteobacteria bacterium]
MIRKVLIISFLSIALLLWLFLDSENSPEDQIRQYIETGVTAAENRSADDLAELIHDNYLDLRGINKAQLTRLLRLYFFRHKNIYLFTKLKEINFLSDKQAQVSLYVAMAGTLISDLTTLSSLRAQIYEFELQLIKDEEWLLREAKWQAIAIGDIQ